MHSLIKRAERTLRAAEWAALAIIKSPAGTSADHLLSSVHKIIIRRIKRRTIRPAAEQCAYAADA